MANVNQNKQRRISIIQWVFLPIVALSLFLTFSNVDSAHASPIVGFDPARIIDDGVFTKSGSMNASQIQLFLNSKVPTCDTWGTQTSEFGGGTRAQWGAAHNNPAPFICLKDYSENGSSAAQIIYNIAQQYQINPQVLIVLLQKEQGLVTDTWPLASQYKTATGYGCPDTAACDSQYFGLTNQLAWSAKMFRAIMNNSPTWYTPYILGNNFISWNPAASCGGSTVNIQNRATQALYNYTPYQPNQAALNAGYGMGDSCSAYGNRNFFAYFTDWFGPTLSNVSLQKSTSSNTVYVVYDGRKQGIPSSAVLSAWGLSGLSVYTVSDVALGAIPDGGILTLLAKNPYNPSMLLLADNGGFFSAWPDTISNFGLDPNTASTITPSLLSMSSRSSNLSPFIQTSSLNGVLLIDKGTYHSFSSWDTLADWAGSTPTISSISDSLFSSLTANTNYGIFSGQAKDSAGNRFLMDNGLAYPLTGSLNTNYPQDRQTTVDTALITTLPKSAALSPFIKSSSSGTIYLIDGGKKLGFTNGEVFASFLASDHIGTVSNLSQSTIDSLANGSLISSRFIYNSSTPTNGYYVDGSVIPLAAPFATNNYGLPVSADTINDLAPSANTTNCGDGTGFIKSSVSATIYMLENGTKRPITNPKDFSLLDTSGSLCTLHPNDISIIPDGQIVTPFVQYNSGYYLLENNKRYATDLPTLANLGVSSTVQISSQLFNTYSNGGTLSLSFTENGNYDIISNGSYYSTTNSNIGSLWNISTQAHTKWLTQGLTNSGTLDQYAKSSNTSDGTVYLIDGGVFHGITDSDSFINSGAYGKNIAVIDAGFIATHSGTLWQGYLAKDSAGNIWVLDGGTKRQINSSSKADWLGSFIPTPLSDSYLSLLPQGPNLTLSISSSGSYTIYGMDNGTKRGITKLSSYLGTKYDPSSHVTDYLLNKIPTGPVI